MSFDDLRSSLGASPNGPPETEVVDIQLEVGLLGSIVEESEEIRADDSELLAHLESADTMADELEARLDGILGTLDSLLTSLEPKDSDKPQGVVIPRSDRPPSEQS